MKTMTTAAVLAATLAAGAAGAGESWVPVATGGIGNPARNVGDALVIHDSHVWVAASEPEATGERLHLFRAPLTDDTTWTEVAPAWWPSNGRITDLESFAGDLYVSLTAGQVWRYRRAAGWITVTPGWTGTPVRALATWRRPSGVETLCAVRGAADVYCGLESSLPLPLPRAPLADTRNVGGADLLVWRNQVFLAVSGASAASRACEVLRYDGRWSRVTADCFGDALRTWAGKMEAFGEYVYMGTGGHTLNAVYRIDAAGRFTAVTPPFYDAAAGLRRVPAAAVAARRLFLGTDVSYSTSAGLAEVVTTSGATWARSNTPGFGSDANLSTNALAGSRTLLYAATFNAAAGFEVWRRDFPLIEGVPSITGDTRDFLRYSRWLEACLRHGPSPGCPAWPQVAAPFARIDVLFATARHPDDDAKLILATRQRLAKARVELEAAQSLAASADKVATYDPAGARPLYDAAAKRLGTARETTRAAWRTVVAALKKNAAMR